MPTRLLLTVLLVACGASAASGSATTYVKFDTAHTLRSYPGNNAPQSASLPANAVAAVKGAADADGQPWLRVAAAGQTGWTEQQGTSPASKLKSDAPSCKRNQSHSSGTPSNGHQTGAVLFPAVTADTFAWNFRDQRIGGSHATRWGQCNVVRKVLRAIAAYRRDNPGAPQVAVGDFSRRRGGEIDGHDTHENGKQVDIYYPRNDGQRMEPHTVAQVNQRLARSLVKHLLATGVKTAFIGQNTTGIPTSSKVRRWPNHDDHVHLFF